MEKDVINFGIGFVTGRSNVCRLINSYYKEIMEQLQRYSSRVNITIFILFDTTYQQTTREEFYNIKPEVYENIRIKYITPEDIENEITNRYERIYNVKTDSFESIENTSVLDSTEVLIKSLENAISITNLLLNTNSLVINEQLKNIDIDRDINI